MAGGGTRTTGARLGDENVHTPEGNEGRTNVLKLVRHRSTVGSVGRFQCIRQVRPVWVGLLMGKKTSMENSAPIIAR